jgi:hypothetical protein
MVDSFETFHKHKQTISSSYCKISKAKYEFNQNDPPAFVVRSQRVRLANSRCFEIRQTVRLEIRLTIHPEIRPTVRLDPRSVSSLHNFQEVPIAKGRAKKGDSHDWRLDNAGGQMPPVQVLFHWDIVEKWKTGLGF